jgi:hypothetical protein
MGFGRTRGYDANVVASPRVHDHEQFAGRPNAHRDESLLIRIGLIIRDGDGVRVIENRNRFGYADAVLAEIDPSLARLIPLESYSLSVRTHCAYVNSDSSGRCRGVRAVAGACGFCVQIAFKKGIASKLRQTANSEAFYNQRFSPVTD